MGKVLFAKNYPIMKKDVTSQKTLAKISSKRKLKLAFAELEHEMEILNKTSQKMIVGGADMLEFYRRMGFAFEQDSSGSYIATSPVWQLYQSGNSGSGYSSGNYGSGTGSGYDSGGSSSGSEYNYSGDYTTEIVRINGGILVETHFGVQYYGENGDIAFFAGVQIQTEGVTMGSGSPFQLNTLTGNIGISPEQANGTGGYNFSMQDFASVYGNYLQGIGGPTATEQTRKNLIKDLLATTLPGLSGTNVDALYTLAIKIFETAASGSRSFDDSFFTGNYAPDMYFPGSPEFEQLLWDLFWKNYNDGPGPGDSGSGMA